MASALTPRAIARMEPGLVATVDRLLDRMEHRVDLIEDFAAAIPVEIIGNLLDVPLSERGPLRDWSLAILGALEPAPGPEVLARGNRAVAEFTAYLQGLVARRRAAPGDPEVDVLTRLIHGTREGETLSETELLQNCIFILNAGHETTTNLIGNTLALLEDFPDQRARLLDDPDLIGPAIEESLRYLSPNQFGNRQAVEDVEIGGRRGRGGDGAAPVHRGGEPRPCGVRRARPLRHCPQTEPASGFCRRPACLRGADTGAAGRESGRQPVFCNASPATGWRTHGLRAGGYGFRGYARLEGVVG